MSENHLTVGSDPINLYLNIGCQSVSWQQAISHEAPVTIAPSVTITTNQMSSELLFCNASGQVIFPTGSSIANSSNLSLFAVTGSVFKMMFVNGSAGSVTFGVQSGCTLADPSMAVASHDSRLVYMVCTGPATYTFY